ncbi:Essential protein Yae1, N terminal [Orbilia brochopaga]|uniref:Protein YAE1 n=1 Tax=Orbilia brochopaga TaxID=3140254 RepID=A0AAV9V3J3_9PEZI
MSRTVLIASAVSAMAIHPDSHESAYDEDYYDTTNIHPDSTTRLASKHTTEGYRDGITASKQQHVQAGFDEGYILGAALGLKIGELLGVLNGLVGTVNGQLSRCTDDGERQKLSLLLYRLKKVRLTARQELCLEKVFGREYFGEDGVWKWSAGDDPEKEQTFDDIVQRHPLVIKWTNTVEQQVKELELELADDHDAGGAENDHS